MLPTDGVVIHSSDLKVDESTLTGEPDHVNKNEEEDVLLFSGNRANYKIYILTLYNC